MRETAPSDPVRQALPMPLWEFVPLVAGLMAWGGGCGGAGCIVAQSHECGGSGGVVTIVAGRTSPSERVLL